MPCRNTITQSLIYSFFAGKEISKVCSFSIHTTEGLLKGTSSDGVIDYFRRRSSCAVAAKKKKSGCTRTKRERGRQDNLEGWGVHRLVFIVWLWFNQGSHTPSLRPPSTCTCSKPQTECKAGRGGVFICICAQWHGCRGFEIIWLCKEGNSNSWCQTGGVKRKVLKSSLHIWGKLTQSSHRCWYN